MQSVVVFVSAAAATVVAAAAAVDLFFLSILSLNLMRMQTTNEKSVRHHDYMISLLFCFCFCHCHCRFAAAQPMAKCEEC